ncbi:MAG: argininosuccinate lyase [bacterium]|nr:argininosuccinate lyase [bacterium]
MEKKTKLWGGRFKKELDIDAARMSYSFDFDKRLYSYDIKTNMAYARALAQLGILSEPELKALNDFFDDLLEKFESNDPSIYGEDEDIHSCIERLVTKALGDVGKKLHTGKSRNDQVVTDMRLFLKDEIREIIKLIDSTLRAIYDFARQYEELIFPGFTHMQTAQPVLLAHHMLAYFEMFKRDRLRFMDNLERTDVCPLGSGALAGNNYEIDRSLLAKELGFSKMSRNSMDAVSDRDFILEFCSASSICMTHFSRICEELVLWSSPLIGFIQIGDEFTTGSSIMPQKKNSDIAELIRGKSGRVLGNFTALQHVIKGLPLTYNRDLQEDKEILFDTVDTLKSSIKCFYKMLATVTVRAFPVNLSLKKGYILATDFADYLVKKGVPFREAHEITGRVVLFAVENSRQLEELTLKDLKGFSGRIENDVFKVFNVKQSVDDKDVYGGTASRRVKYQLNRIKEDFRWEM